MPLLYGGEVAVALIILAIYPDYQDERGVEILSYA